MCSYFMHEIGSFLLYYRVVAKKQKLRIRRKRDRLQCKAYDYGHFPNANAGELTFWTAASYKWSQLDLFLFRPLCYCCPKTKVKVSSAKEKIHP